MLGSGARRENPGSRGRPEKANGKEGLSASMSRQFLASTALVLFDVNNESKV